MSKPEREGKGWIRTGFVLVFFASVATAALVAFIVAGGAGGGGEGGGGDSSSGADGSAVTVDHAARILELERTVSDLRVALAALPNSSDQTARVGVLETDVDALRRTTEKRRSPARWTAWWR